MLDLYLEEEMKNEEFWEVESILKDLLFESNMPLASISKELEISQKDLNILLNKMGLKWVKANSRKLSRGHAALTSIMQNILPNEEIVNEYHIGDRLRLDVYCQSYALAAEYHGRQHFFYSNLFHKDLEDFNESVERDRKKEQMCKDNGIALIVFRFCDKLTEDAVFERMLEAIRSTPRVEIEKVKKNFKGNFYYEKMKINNREYKKARYRELKKRNGS